MYIALKCFMLHVFYVIRIVRITGSDGGTAQEPRNGAQRAEAWRGGMHVRVEANSQADGAGQIEVDGADCACEASR
jgi:hypothetical protein